MLKLNKRIHGRNHVALVLKKGDQNKSRFFALRSLENSLGFKRYGIVISRKVEKSAVKRNRKRRQIYDAIRELEQKGLVPSEPGSDIVILARMKSMELNYQELLTDLQTLLKQ